MESEKNRVESQSEALGDNGQFKIEHNVPIPQTRVLGGLCKVLSRMQIGDSIVIPTRPGRTSAHVLAARAGIKVITRKENDTEIRVWRTK